MAQSASLSTVWRRSYLGIECSLNQAWDSYCIGMQSAGYGFMWPLPPYPGRGRQMGLGVWGMGYSMLSFNEGLALPRHCHDTKGWPGSSLRAIMSPLAIVLPSPAWHKTPFLQFGPPRPSYRLLASPNFCKIVWTQMPPNHSIRIPAVHQILLTAPFRLALLEST